MKKPQHQARILTSILQLFPSCVISFLINLLEKELGFVMGVIYYAARYSSGNVIILKASYMFIFKRKVVDFHLSLMSHSLSSWLISLEFVAYTSLSNCQLFSEELLL